MKDLFKDMRGHRLAFSLSMLVNIGLNFCYQHLVVPKLTMGFFPLVVVSFLAGLTAGIVGVVVFNIIKKK